TPNQAFSILQAGQYRVQASEDGNSTLVTVRAGMGEVTGGGRTYSVGSGLAGNFTGTDSLYADIFKAGGNDEFDSWSQDRDRHDDGSRSARDVSPDVVGYEDLDDNGTWRSHRESGEIGAGCPARSLSDPSTRRRLWLSSAGRASAWRFQSVEAVAMWGGSPWALE